MLRMLFTVFNLCPKIPSQEFLSTKEVTSLLMTCKFLDFRRMQDIKFREMDREMRCPIYDLRETH